MKTLAEGVDTVWQNKRFRKEMFCMVLGVTALSVIGGAVVGLTWLGKNHEQILGWGFAGAIVLALSWVVGHIIHSGWLSR